MSIGRNPRLERVGVTPDHHLLGRRHPGRFHHGRRESSPSPAPRRSSRTAGADRMGARQDIRIVASADDHDVGHAEITDTPTGRRPFRRTACAARRASGRSPRRRCATPLFFQPVPLDLSRLPRRCARIAATSCSTSPAPMSFAGIPTPRPYSPRSRPNGGGVRRRHRFLHPGRGDGSRSAAARRPSW